MEAMVLPTSPEGILSFFGIEEPSQIDIEAIAYNFGAHVRRAHLGGCEGRVLGMGNRAIITVNSTSSVGRQRFSIAHELGHWLKDRELVLSRCHETTLVRSWGNSTNGSQRELRANKFASDLLLPTIFFSRHARHSTHTLTECSKLADEFRASLTATAIRLVQSNVCPAIVLFSERGRRTWFFRNSLVPERIWPLEQIGRGSIASTLVERPYSSGIQEGEVDVSHWFGRVEEDKYFLHESSVVVAGGVLTLLWWQDESHIIAELEDG